MAKAPLFERKFKYITNRILKDKEGKDSGEIKVAVPIDNPNAKVKYKCPECGFSEMKEQEWKKPFNVKCAKCGFLMRMGKLLAQLKKEKKMEKEAKRKASGA